jgi:hypothetical protein
VRAALRHRAVPHRPLVPRDLDRSDVRESGGGASTSRLDTRVEICGCVAAAFHGQVPHDRPPVGGQVGDPARVAAADDPESFERREVLPDAAVLLTRVVGQAPLRRRRTAAGSVGMVGQTDQ